VTTTAATTPTSVPAGLVPPPDRPATTSAAGHGDRRVAFAVAAFTGLTVCVVLVWALQRDLHTAMDLRAFRWGLLFAVIPVLPLTAFFIWLDRLRPEPVALLVVALLWGALAATYFSLKLNGWLVEEMGDYGASPRSAIFVAPWVEETMKAAVVFGIVFWRRHDFNSVIAGVVYGGLTGVGFAFTENILYYGQQFQAVLKGGAEPSQALDSVQDLFQWRGIAAPFVHPMFTMMTGLGIGLAVRYRHLGVRILAPVAGFCAAVLLHMSYNAIVSFVAVGNLASVYVPILLPTLFALLALVAAVRRHEREVMRARLHDYARFGWLRPDHVDLIVTWSGRHRARAYARQFGKAELRRVRAFQKTGLDLGVLRDRMVRGVAGGAELPRERQLIQTMRDFRGRVMLPGISERPLDQRTTVSSSW
jgi:protease PrsW